MPAECQRKSGLKSGRQSPAASTALGAETSTAANLARLFIVFAAAHLFLDAAAFDELAKASDGLLDAFSITNDELDHLASQTGFSILLKCLSLLCLTSLVI